MLLCKGKQALPKFQTEGYAVYENERDITLPEGIKFRAYSGEIIGVKSDAPQWAKDEYSEFKEEYLKEKEEIKRGILIEKR